MLACAASVPLTAMAGWLCSGLWTTDVWSDVATPQLQSAWGTAGRGVRRVRGIKSVQLFLGPVSSLHVACPDYWLLRLGPEQETQLPGCKHGH